MVVDPNTEWPQSVRIRFEQNVRRAPFDSIAGWLTAEPPNLKPDVTPNAQLIGYHPI
jgi:hypothetical protein